MGDIMRHVNIHGKHEYAPCGFDDATYSAHNRAMNIARISPLRRAFCCPPAGRGPRFHAGDSGMGGGAGQDFIHVTHIDA